MRWTDKKPTVQGQYWMMMKPGSNSCRVTNVWRDTEGSFYTSDYGKTSINDPIMYCSVLWYGPINPPKLPRDDR